MGENTKIEWADHTFNPWIGCTKVSAGCKFCYAEKDMDHRRHRVTWGVNGTRSVTSYTYWKQALAWNAAAIAEGVRKRVFCASLADIFEDWRGQVVDSKGNPLWFNKDSMGDLKNVDVDGIPNFMVHQQDEARYGLTLNDIRDRLFLLIEETPNLDWLFVTKRPENIMRMIPADWKRVPPKNVWYGTSVESDEHYGRIDELINVPASLRFLSCEPLLSGLDDISKYLGGMPLGQPIFSDRMGISGKIHWVIAGGESGPNARAPHPDWFRELRDWCLIKNVPFLFKQWGEWAPHRATDAKKLEGVMYKGLGQDMCWVGKKSAGRELDGEIYNQIPFYNE